MHPDLSNTGQSPSHESPTGATVNAVLPAELATPRGKNDGATPKECVQQREITEARNTSHHGTSCGPRLAPPAIQRAPASSTTQPCKRQAMLTSLAAAGATSTTIAFHSLAAAPKPKDTAAVTRRKIQAKQDRVTRQLQSSLPTLRELGNGRESSESRRRRPNIVAVLARPGGRKRKQTVPEEQPLDGIDRETTASEDCVGFLIQPGETYAPRLV